MHYGANLISYPFQTAQSFDDALANTSTDPISAISGEGIASLNTPNGWIGSLSGFEGGKGFAGGSAAYVPFGHRLIAGPLWEEAILPVTLDLDTVTQARTEEPLFSDLERTWTRLLVNSPGAGVGHPDIIRAKTTGASDGGGTA